MSSPPQGGVEGASPATSSQERGNFKRSLSLICVPCSEGDRMKWHLTLTWKIEEAGQCSKKAKLLLLPALPEAARARHV